MFICQKAKFFPVPNATQMFASEFTVNKCDNFPIRMTITSVSTVRTRQVLSPFLHQSGELQVSYPLPRDYTVA